MGTTASTYADPQSQAGGSLVSVFAVRLTSGGGHAGTRERRKRKAGANDGQDDGNLFRIASLTSCIGESRIWWMLQPVLLRRRPDCTGGVPDGSQARALARCGAGCSVVLTFGRCAAYAAYQGADSTAAGRAEAYAFASAAQEAALAECRSRGGSSGCIVGAWGCNGPVVEEGLNLDRGARRRIQQGLVAGWFGSGGADGLFGRRTRAGSRSNTSVIPVASHIHW